MRRRLVPWPRAALLVIVGCAALVAALGALLHDATTGNWFDDAVLRAIRSDVPHGLQIAALHVSDPWLVLVLIAVTAVACAVRRRWDALALTVAAPALALIISEYVLKPLVHRSNEIVTDQLGLSGTLAYPSGHETALAAIVCVPGVLLLASGARGVLEAAGTSGLALVLVIAAIGLVGRFFHYATDTIGAVGVALAITLSVALVIDRWAASVLAPEQGDTPRNALQRGQE